MTQSDWTLDDLDPDKWMAAGNDLMDFPYPPPDMDTRRAMQKAWDERPALKMRVGRWMQEALALAPPFSEYLRIEQIVSERQLRDLWAASGDLS